jgi:(2Fe-2S) ferredoxin
MSKSCFHLQGQLLAFVIKDGYKVKYLRLAVGDRERWIKLPKKVSATLDPRLAPGCWLDVSGTQKLEKTGKLELKAQTVELAQTAAPRPCPASPATPAPTKILLCGKSSCQKRGGKDLCQALEQNLRDRGLDDRVQIKTTGCLKNCKQGPNLILLPDKTHYRRVQAREVPTIVEKHFTPQPISASH